VNYYAITFLWWPHSPTVWGRQRYRNPTLRINTVTIFLGKLQIAIGRNFAA